jgi:hypothetical protein
MADDKTKTGKPDRDRINVNEDYELRYWAEKFDVTTSRRCSESAFDRS